jgi:hypothetical protein
MAKGRHYSSHQKGIIKRYYENKDSLMTQKLGEIVSELYLCDSDKKADRLWKSARTALLNAGVVEKRVEIVVANRDLEKLAKLVTEIF